ncbi:MAG: helix-turn-helix transcriptional regulator [Nocardioides sp.]
MSGPSTPRCDIGPTVQWSGWVAIDPGRLIYAGKVGTAEDHAHHAVQLLVSRHEPFVLRDAGGRQQAATFAVVPANTAHAIVRGSAEAILVLLDPFSRAGATLGAGSGPDADTWIRAEAMPPEKWRTPAAAVRELTSITSAATPEDQGRVSRSTHVLNAAALIRSRPYDRLTLVDVASAVHVSPGRLGHVFAKEMGLPFRRYVLWERLRCAISLAREAHSLTDAAHGAGFADAAHFSRTFRRMFGAAPRWLGRHVEWRESADSFK